jgi:hypothetical protein
VWWLKRSLDDVAARDLAQTAGNVVDQPPRVLGRSFLIRSFELSKAACARVAARLRCVCPSRSRDWKGPDNNVCHRDRQSPRLPTADARGGQSEPQALKTIGHTICSLCFREAQAKVPGVPLREEARNEPVPGMDEVQTLAASAVSALESANLLQEARYLHSCVLGRSPEALVEMVESESGSGRWSFKPMVELLLREILHVATVRGLSIEIRRARVRWALEASGF